MRIRISLDDLIASKKPKAGSVFFIAVDGHGGSGKSTFSKYLSERLHALIIHTDDFASWDDPVNWWPLVIERIFEPIKNGASTLNYPRSKWWEDHHPEPAVDERVTDIMILEGVGALREEFRDYISIGFFVDTPKELCLARGIARDGNTGKKPEELTQMWNKWFESEDIYMKRDNPKAYADAIIDGTKPIEEQIS